MKVLLVSVNNEKEPFPVAPIGAAYVAQALKEADHDVALLDLCFAGDDHAAVSAALESLSPDIIGLSIRNIDNLTFNKSVFYMPRIKGVVEHIKKRTGVPLVVGGSGFSIFPEEVLGYLGVEYGIRGEGEDAFVQLLAMLERGGSPAAVPNLCSLRGGAFTANPVAYVPEVSRPDRTVVDNKAYYELGGMANVQTKRGCPFTCTYCTYPQVEGKSFRLRAPADIVEELKEVRDRYGAGHAFFVDDIFNVPHDHAAAVCEELARSSLPLRWTCFASPYGMTRELAALMKRAGCTGIEFGSDAGAEKTLRGLGKNFTPEDIAHAAEYCQSIDMPNAHYIIIGGPEEDDATLEETFFLFETIRPTAVIALVGVRIYPRTGLQSRAVEEGIIAQDTDLLEPSFYLTPRVEAGSLMDRVSAYASSRSNVIVPCLSLRCDRDTMLLLRKMGRKGPLWDLLS